jgi:hypothetical protein
VILTHDNVITGPVYGRTNKNTHLARTLPTHFVHSRKSFFRMQKQLAEINWCYLQKKFSDFVIHISEDNLDNLKYITSNGAIFT